MWSRTADMFKKPWVADVCRYVSRAVAAYKVDQRKGESAKHKRGNDSFVLHHAIRQVFEERAAAEGVPFADLGFPENKQVLSALSRGKWFFGFGTKVGEVGHLWEVETRAAVMSACVEWAHRVRIQY